MDIWIWILSKSDNYLADANSIRFYRYSWIQIRIQITDFLSWSGLRSCTICFKFVLFTFLMIIIKVTVVSKVHQISVRFKSAHTYIFFVSCMHVERKKKHETKWSIFGLNLMQSIHIWFQVIGLAHTTQSRKGLWGQEWNVEVSSCLVSG